MSLSTDISQWHHAYILVGDAVASMNDVDVVCKDSDADVIRHHYSGDTFTIDDVRALQQHTHSKARAGEHIIITADYANILHEAQNALLKTLEEPAPHTHIFLLLPRTDFLLDTIHSRVQVINYAGTAEHVLYDPAEFLAMEKADRIKDITERTKKNAPPIPKGDVFTFLNQLEVYVDENITEPKQRLSALETIYQAKEYAAHAGMSAKMVLEFVAIGMIKP